MEGNRSAVADSHAFWSVQWDLDAGGGGACVGGRGRSAHGIGLSFGPAQGTGACHGLRMHAPAYPLPTPPFPRAAPCLWQEGATVASAELGRGGGGNVVGDGQRPGRPTPGPLFRVGAGRSGAGHRARGARTAAVAAPGSPLGACGRPGPAPRHRHQPRRGRGPPGAEPVRALPAGAAAAGLQSWGCRGEVGPGMKRAHSCPLDARPVARCVCGVGNPVVPLPRSRWSRGPCTIPDVVRGWTHAPWFHTPHPILPTDMHAQPRRRACSR